MNKTPHLRKRTQVHQFGHFNKLGDGRAIVIGQYLPSTKLINQEKMIGH